MGEHHKLIRMAVDKNMPVDEFILEILHENEYSANRIASKYELTRQAVAQLLKNRGWVYKNGWQRRNDR